MQIKFWNHIILFCQLDSSQIEVFINMHRICLILRFYDRNKYSEICCKRHMSVIKDEFLGNKVLMNPPMNQKLLSIQNILNIIISSQDPEKAFLLFKLLTLDLSPCLTEFILNIFINEFQKRKQDTTNWNDRFINVLIENKFETIIANTLLHSLPQIKISLLTLVTEISSRLIKNNKIIHFKGVEKVINQLLLPQDNFYAKINNNNIKLEQSTTTNSSVEQTKKEENVSNQNKEQNTKDNPEIKKANTLAESKVSSIISKFETMKEKIPGLTNNPMQKQDSLKVSTKKPEIKPTPSKNIYEEIPDNNYKLNYENAKGEVIIFKNNIYFDYVENVYQLLFLWATNQPPNCHFYQIDFKKLTLEIPNAIEFLLSLALNIDDLIFYIKCLRNLYFLSISPINASKMLSNTRIISFL